MFLKKIALSLASVLALTANAHAHDFIDTAGFPGWFNEAMQREGSLNERSELSLPELSVNSEVLGTLVLADTSTGTWYYTIDIGSDVPMECWVFTEYDGTANSMHGISQMGLESAETLNEKALSGQFNFALDVGVVGTTAYAAYDTLYHLGEGDQKVAGLMKAMAAETNDSLQVCLHNELGYRETFKQAFVAFIQAFENAKPTNAFYQTAYAWRINGIPVGFSRESYAKDEDGDVVIESSLSMLVPVDANSVARTDSFSNSWSMPDGALINGQQYTIENGVMASTYRIDYKDEKWEVAGKIQNKDIAATLEYNQWLQSEYGNYLSIESLRNSDETSDTFFMWSPDADPTSALEVSLEQTESNDTFQLNMSLFTFLFEIDANNAPISGTIDYGVMKMTLDQMVSTGTPKLP